MAIVRVTGLESACLVLRVAAAPVILLATLGLPLAIEAQIHRSPPPQGATTHIVTPGARYDAAGLRSWFFGNGYRSLWASPVQVPVLNLDTEKGGLTVTETGGYGQTFTLEFRGADDLDYAVRSLDKDPTRRLDPLLQNTIVADVIQDQTSAFMPTAGLVVDPLLEAAGLLHPRHKLVVVPDDPRLGEFREDHAGLIGMFIDRPQEGPDNTPGFAGSTRISGTETFLEELEEAECDRPDAREYLKARFIDMLVGDRDRHEGQWRWARYPSEPAYPSESGCHVWRPIPEDRDQAFIHPDGVLMAIYRLVDFRMVDFGPEFPSLPGLTFNGWEVDRRILSEFDEPVWVAVAEELKRELTDAVIEDAVRRLPEAHYDQRGVWLEYSLKSRRDALTNEALAYYRLISKTTEITASDRDEVAVFEHLPQGGLALAVRYANATPDAEARFQRTFDPSVTDEVRLFLHGGDDRVEIRGAGGDIRVIAIGGGGDDLFINESQASRSQSRIFDSRGDNRFEGRFKVDESDFERPPSTNLVHNHALDWGGIKRRVPFITYSPDVGAQFGFLFSIDEYGFRKVPWYSRNSIQATVSTVGPEVVLAWDGRFREVMGHADAVMHLEYSGLNILRFHGFGNGTEMEGDSEFFKVRQRQLIFAPSAEWTFGHETARKEKAVSQFNPKVRVGLGPIVKYSNTPEEKNLEHFIGTLDPAPLGTGSFGQVGVQGWVNLDTRDNVGYPTKGFHALAAASAFPAVWHVKETFGEIHGMVSAFLTPAWGAHAPTFAFRGGAKAVLGTFPFHEAAYLGGRDNVRGLREDRFAGEESLYGNVELRLPLINFQLLFPAEFGIHGAADGGRVYFDGESDEADDWHNAFGGGVWLSFMGRAGTVSLSVMKGDDLTAVYLATGLHF